MTRIVASSATINDMKLKLTMISSSFFCGFHISGVCISPFASMLLSDILPATKNVLPGTGRVLYENAGFSSESDPLSTSIAQLVEDFVVSLRSL